MQGTQKTDFLKDLSRYEAHKARSKEFVAYLKNYFYECGHRASLKEVKLRKQINRLDECGSFLLFRNYYLKKEIRLIGANFCCQHKLCGLCAIRRAAKGAQNLHEKAEQVLSEQEHLKAFYIVLTVKNEADLAHGMRKLKKGWDRIKWKIRDSKRARKTNNPSQSKYASALNSQFSDVVAGAYSIEITYNEQTKEWHPHMNLLLLSESQMSNNGLSKEWESYTGDSYITYCQELDIEEDKWAFCEIMKYAMKFSELSFQQNIEAYLELCGQRLKGTIGEFRGVDLEPDAADETLEGEPYIEILFSYYNGQYRETGERTAAIEATHERSWVPSDLLPRAK